MAKRFAEHNGLNLTQVNNDILEMWREKNVFWRSVDEREGCPQFVFFEGPPSANGHPGIHHVLARTIKDTFNRYKNCVYLRFPWRTQERTTICPSKLLQLRSCFFSSILSASPNLSD